MRQLRYALIGCGRIAANHIQAAVRSGLLITAICDIAIEKMESLLQKSAIHKKGISFYTDYKEMLNMEQLDLVAIATESGCHGEIALACISHGIHTIIEKPVTLSINEAEELIRQQKEHGVKVTVCHQNRFNKSIQFMKEVVKSHSIGEISYASAAIRWARDENYYKQAPWRGTWEQDGGALMNQCIHNIDLLLWMVDSKPVKVIGMTGNRIHPYIETEDFGSAVIRFENGAFGVIEGTTAVVPTNLEETLYLFGSKGTIGAGGTSVNRIEVWNLKENKESLNYLEQYHENPSNVYGFGHLILYQDMIVAIHEDREPIIGLEDGKAALEIILAIYLSSRTGKAVTLPLKDISTKTIQSM